MSAFVRRVRSELVGPYAAVGIAALVYATGGRALPFAPLFIPLLVASAALATTRRFVVTGVVAGPLILAPYIYVAEPRYPATLAAVSLVVFGTVLVALHLLVRRLRSGEARYRMLAENVDDVLYRLRLRPDVAFEYVSPAARWVTGFPPEAFVSDPSLSLRRAHPDDVEMLRAIRLRPVDHCAGPVTFRWLHADGTWVWLEERLHLHLDQRGEPEALTGIVRDITPQRDAEQALQAALAREHAAAQELQTLNEIKTGFLQAVSHELRTPLAAVLGFAQTARDHRQELTSAELDHLLDRLAWNARKLTRIVTDLLDVDRLARGDVTPDLQSVDLATIVRQVVEELDPVDRSIVMAFDESQVIADPGHLERIVENLLANAVRHTPPGTQVVVRLHCLPTSAEMVVEDDGPGVPDALKARVFEPFEQGRDALHSHAPGTGIGLAVVARLAELHDGRAWVDDRPGGGARFHVLLPTRGVSVDGAGRVSAHGSLAGG